MGKPSRKRHKPEQELGITAQTLGDLLRLGITPPPLPLIDPDPDETNVLICDRYGAFPDDVHGKCASCGEPVAWRPHAPSFLIKVCIPCAMAGKAQELGA